MIFEKDWSLCYEWWSVNRYDLEVFFFTDRMVVMTSRDETLHPLLNGSPRKRSCSEFYTLANVHQEWNTILLVTFLCFTTFWQNLSREICELEREFNLFQQTLICISVFQPLTRNCKIMYENLSVQLVLLSSSGIVLWFLQLPSIPWSPLILPENNISAQLVNGCPSRFPDLIDACGKAIAKVGGFIWHGWWRYSKQTGRYFVVQPSAYERR